MTTSQRSTIEEAWAHLAAGKLDELAALYTEDMVFALPGQTDELHGREAFRSALEGIGSALPPGFDIGALHYFEGDAGVVNIVEWTSEKLPDGTQSAILWSFDEDGKISEERWYVDTEQWKIAF